MKSTLCLRHFLWTVSFAILVLLQSDRVRSTSGLWAVNPSYPCVYEDHLVTEKNWFGYLANITIMTTGRLTFEFSYPADKCCQNILFYSEDQMSIINARMNCWQKEYLLRPEEDQILRLTPRFSWSGCHMTHPNDIATYVCKGGRSFTVEQPGDRPTTWYIAASNCATLQGLDLEYRMEIFGHIGDCRSTPHLATGDQPTASVSAAGGGGGGLFASSAAVLPSPRADMSARDPEVSSASASAATCVVEGDVNTTATWHGFFANISVVTGGGFSFRFTYPYHMQVQNVILYNEDDVLKLGWDRNCWQKEGLVHSHHVPEQIIDLSYRSSWNGCVSRNSSYGRNLTCQGERRYDKPRRFYVAVSNCRAVNGLLLSYRFEVFGYDVTDMCSAAETGRWRLVASAETCLRRIIAGCLAASFVLRLSIW